MNLELFSCSGGLAEGLRRAGITIDMAFDADPDACDSYEANLALRPVQIDARDLLTMVRGGWRPGAIDLFVADPPCTPWSRAGKRLGQADERDMLGVTVELVTLLRPRAYLIANVPGLDDGPNWPTVQRTIGGLSRAGYCSNDFRRFDAADFGVPQHRLRPFWFGHRDGPCLQWPEPTHADPAKLAGDNLHLKGLHLLAPWVSVREALSSLAPEDLGRPIRLRRRACNSTQHGSVADRPARVVGTSNLSDGNVLLSDRARDNGSLRDHEPDLPARTIRASRSDSERLLLTHPRHPISQPDAPSYTITAKAEQGAQGGAVLAWPWERPATTVTADARLAPPGHHAKSFLSDNRGHGPNAIVLSERAAAILQGFPDGWMFAGKTKRARWAQIGMAMPPPLAAEVGRAIARWLKATAPAAATAPR